MEDADTLSELRSASILELTAKFYGNEERIAWSRNRNAEDFRRVLKTGEERIRCAILDDEIIGFACLNGDMIWGLHVRPDRTRRGVGTLLIHDLESIALQVGTSLLRVAASLNAVSLYTRLDYRTYATAQLIICDPLSGLCVTLGGLSMMKPLQ